MLYSIVIPTHNEEGSIENTITALIKNFDTEKIPHEILVVNDNSTDGTVKLLERLMTKHPTMRYVNNQPPNGFGLAVRKGLEEFKGDAVAIVMADGSDSSDDVVRFYRKLQEGYDCVFGSRFIKGGKVVNYPWTKLIFNRFGNKLIQILFGLRYNDITNAFKCYRRGVIQGVQPLLSHHFNLTVEIPLKAIVRGFSYAVLPNIWTNRQHGIAKFKIKEMGSRYLFIILYVLLEKHLSQGDYHRNR